tara:strand:- start:334 stop:558 length:225 start_codon:yes stop_codon:yes gene_type:complete
MKPKYANECDHNTYLGSDNEDDYYLYINDVGILSICRRYGDHGSEYETISSYHNIELNPRFIDTLTYITKLRQS